MKEEMLNLRKNIKKKKPRFKRQEWFRKKALKDTWRKPRGINSKLRTRKMSRGRIPKPGYGSPKSVRGLDRKGFREILISNVKDLENINPKEEVAVISKTVGRKKKFEIIEYARKNNIRIGNHKFI